MIGTTAADRGKPAHRDPNVLRWVAAYSASVAGDSVYFLSLAWAATAVGGPSAAGWVTAVGALPRALLMLVGGVVADRFGPRPTIIVSDASRCVLIVVAAALLWAVSPGLWLLLPLAAVFGVVDALFMPAVGALPPRITRPDQLGRVQAMRSLAVRAGNLAGPAIAGAALTTGRPATAFAVAGVLFLLSLVLLIAVRTRPLPASEAKEAAGDRPAWQDFKDGLAYIRRHHILAPLLTVIGLSEMCFSGPVGLALVLLADERGWGAASVGWMLGAFSVGGAAGAIALAARPRLERAGPVCAAFFALTAAATAALPAMPGPLAATCVAALVGTASGMAGIVAHALVQTHTDPHYLGRVTAVLTLGTVGLSPLVFPLTGVAASAWGTGSVLVGCAVITASAAVTMTAKRALRRSAT
ncbi:MULTISPECIES: MFS transporter [Streptomyces]|uniref:MFS transporter n=1 Tax=unclassified Streptomyces TaxID=2593676 RepID=UPI0006868822|nr:MULTISPECIES: MFS transporter [Streptomyces]